ncbi:MAG: hypothetical protein J6S67_11200 [Methanobrevibacter sp.]|nr:hypothetical protein [Methanobrevibacter sp.]
MKSLYNKSLRAYVHQQADENGKIITYRLNPGATVAIPDNIADIWLKSNEIMEVGKEDKAKDEEIARLKAENEKLKAEAEKPEEEEKKPAKAKRTRKAKKDEE